MLPATSRWCVALALLPFADAPPLRAQALPPAQAAAIDSFVLRTMQVRRIPGVAVAVVDDGRVVYRRRVGGRATSRSG
ncbi:MAG: hypothetical protein ACREM1_08395 [Longimicrobiales bacterium]